MLPTMAVLPDLPWPTTSRRQDDSVLPPASSASCDASRTARLKSVCPEKTRAMACCSALSKRKLKGSMTSGTCPAKISF